MNKESLYYVLFEQQKDWHQEKNFVPREITPKVVSLLRLKLPIVITGVRRAGKSTLLKLIKKELTLQEHNSFYINFNDERLINFSTEDFQIVLEFLQQEGYTENCYIFLDEIQEVNNWEKWVDRIKEKHPLVITGSNSKLLSKEISTILTGRSINITLYPFSFVEFLSARNVDISLLKKDRTVKIHVQNLFLEYLSLGGIPKVVIDKEKQLLSELYENIIYRDIIKRFNPNLEKHIKEISMHILSNISCPLSQRTLSEITGVKNFSTLKAILNTFENAFLLLFTSKFDFSLRKQIQNPRKVYCIDTGFVSELGFRSSENKGRLLENLVFIELKRRIAHTYYFSGNNECDFVVREGHKITQAVQVCYELTPENRKREIGGLIVCMNQFKLKKGIILTFSQEEECPEDKRIKIVPVWKWLLEKK